MFRSYLGSCARVALISGAALVVTACSSTGTYRLATVGDVPGATGGDGSGGDTGNGGNGGNTGGGNTGGNTGGGGNGNGGGNGTGSGGTDTGSQTLGGGILATAGNAVIGLASKVDQVAAPTNSAVPVTTPVTGTVTAVLKDTGQTLVKLGTG